MIAGDTNRHLTDAADVLESIGTPLGRDLAHRLRELDEELDVLVTIVREVGMATPVIRMRQYVEIQLDPDAYDAAREWARNGATP